jgi:parallel beta-helix repeat protein
MRSRSLVPLLSILACPAFASNGVVEINQTCAVQTGCFAGDASGFPVTIDGTAGRSDRLTSDLVVPDENVDAIVVDTSALSVDLAGFEITRAGCVGAQANCTPGSGTGSGIERVSTANIGISIRDGSITGMGGYGFSLGDQASVDGVRLRWNRLDGVQVGGGSSVSGNTSLHKGGNGISAALGSTVSGNTVYGNGLNGISSGGASTISANTAYANGLDGINASAGSTVTGNTASQNSGDGIQTSSSCTVAGNTVQLNSGYGLNMNTLTAYRGNTIASNVAGAVAGTATNAGNNVCNGSLACP